MKKSPLLLAFLAIGFMFHSCSEQGSTTEESSESTKNEETKASSENTADGTYMIDTEKSVVKWEGTMVGMYSHNGTLDFSKGSVTIKDGKITGGELVVDMTSITPTDENYNAEEGKTKEKLVKHLMSDDFFLVSEHPNATFKISGSNETTVKGEMTIRGNANMIAIDGYDMHVHDGEVHLTASTELDRQAYDVAFSHPMEDMVLSDDLKIDIDITATK